MTEQEMMEAWMKTASVGPEHQLLTRFNGQWKVTMKSWNDPNAPVTESEGTAELASILGGRVRTEKFQCEWGGMPFEGFGMIGYDNRSQTFWLTWNDNMSTNCFYVGGGTISPDRRTITFNGDMPAPDGSTSKVRMVYRLENEDNFIFEHFDLKDGSERRTMEMNYRRK